MSFEKSTRLSESEARGEADMLRMKLGEMVNHEPTTADYDKALEAIEEMKRLAEEEPEFDKILFRMMQIGNKYFQDTADGLIWILTMDRRPNEGDAANRDWHLHMFDDASAQLKKLKEDAEQVE